MARGGTDGRSCRLLCSGPRRPYKYSSVEPRRLADPAPPRPTPQKESQVASRRHHLSSASPVLYAVALLGSLVVIRRGSSSPFRAVCRCHLTAGSPPRPPFAAGDEEAGGGRGEAKTGAGRGGGEGREQRRAKEGGPKGGSGRAARPRRIAALHQPRILRVAEGSADKRGEARRGEASGWAGGRVRVVARWEASNRQSNAHTCRGCVRG